MPAVPLAGRVLCPVLVAVMSDAKPEACIVCLPRLVAVASLKMVMGVARSAFQTGPGSSGFHIRMRFKMWGSRDDWWKKVKIDAASRR
jgi:hypothetical protein